MNATNTTPAPAKKATAKAPAKKAAPPAKKATSTKSDASQVDAPKVEKALRITPSTDPQHQAWQATKKDLTAVMADLLYDSRRVVPDHAKSPEEAYAKVGAALKALTEFTESIRLK